MTAFPIHHDPTDTRPHAVVIGSGFGGLAGAIRLGARGYRVTVIERLDRIGGRAMQFERDGHVFDAGPTIITAPFVFEELWSLCGKRMADDVELVSLDPFYSIRFNDGTVFRPTADPDRMAEEIAKFDERDAEGFRRYLKESRKNFDVGFLGMVDRPFVTLAQMAGAMPGLIRRRADRSIVKLVARYIRNEKIRQALSFHPLFIGGNPLRTSGVMSLISYLEKEYGIHYAMGGTHALIKGMAGLVRHQGGRILTGIEAEEILVDAGGTARGIRLKGGEDIRSDIVVSNADAGLTLSKLIPERFQGRWTKKRVKRAKHSMSLFLWYFGTDRRFEDVDHHTILMGPRYGDLLTDIFDRKHLADDFSLYLYRPSATDPSVAPAGRDTFYVLSPVPNLDADIDWETHAEPYRRKIEAYLEATIMPGLSKAVTVSEVRTPHYFRDALLSANGAAFSFEPVIWQLAWFRPHNRHEVMKNLFLVGAGTHPGAGLPGVVSSAKILDALVPDATVMRQTDARPV